MTTGTIGAVARPGSTPRSWAPAVLAVVGRPRLWPTAVRVVRRLVRPGWARRWPLLPVPDPAYLRFRMLTAYGDERAVPAAHDVVTYLEWCRAWDANPRLRGGARR